MAAKAGQVVDSDKLVLWASLNGYLRVPTVRETGEYAVRGGIIDLYPASMETPLRFDFFGRQLESIRTFDPGTHTSCGSAYTSYENHFTYELIADQNASCGPIWPNP